LKFLDAAKNAKFAADLLTAAGFNLEELRKAGDANALKTAIDAKAKPAEGPSAKDLEDAVAENTRLESENMALKQEKKTYDIISEIMASSGIKIAEAFDGQVFSKEKFNTAFNAAIAKQSRIALARVGHAPVEETPTEKPAKKEIKSPEGVTGADRVRHAFSVKSYVRGSGTN
jgi:hypothetical protein